MDFRKLLRVPATKLVAFLAPRFRGKRPSFTIWRTATTEGPNAKRNGDTEAATQQEHNDVYDLGKTRLALKMMINDDTITTLDEQNYGTAAYKKYQQLARQFNIDLPDPPREKNIDRENKNQFFCEQIDKVERYIFSKPNKIGHLYNAAIKVEKSRRILEMSIDDHVHLIKYFKEVKEAAQKLDVDINDDLNHLENYYNFDTEFISRIKTKLCEVKQAAKRSEVDRNQIITDEYWAVSLVRLPDTLFCEHAFLVLEGKTGEKSMIWFADFVANDRFSLFCPGTQDGRVRIERHLRSEDEIVDSSSELLYRCSKKMMKISNRSRLIYSTWPISKSAAERLINNLETQKNNAPKYNLLGDTALAAGSATLLRKPTGHNCFTFAKMMLHDLKKVHIQVPGDKVEEWIVSAASRFLVDKQPRWKKYMIWLGLFVAGGGTGSICLKLFNF